MIRLAAERRITLTLALSHPMGEGINTIAREREHACLQKTRCAFSLSHRMGEGRGEGKRLIRRNLIKPRLLFITLSDLDKGERPVTAPFQWRDPFVWKTSAILRGSSFGMVTNK